MYNKYKPNLERISTNDYKPEFSKLGLGIPFSKSFNTKLLKQDSYFNSTIRGRNLFIVADFSGQEKNSLVETYSFLVLDLEANLKWFKMREDFRKYIFKQNRKISFKSMNDIYRRIALFDFLNIGLGINGVLVTFVVSKKINTIFEQCNSFENKLSSAWKPRIREKVSRVIHMGGFLISGLSCPHQDVLFLTDNDEISSNLNQLSIATNLVANVIGNSIGHTLRHLKFGNTNLDDGSLVLEDLASYPDLAAGAISELITSYYNLGLTPTSGLILPNPKKMKDKTKIVLDWMSQEQLPLKNICALIELDKNGQGLTYKVLKLNRFF